MKTSLQIPTIKHTQIHIRVSSTALFIVPFLRLFYSSSQNCSHLFCTVTQIVMDLRLPPLAAPSSKRFPPASSSSNFPPPRFPHVPFGRRGLEHLCLAPLAHVPKAPLHARAVLPAPEKQAVRGLLLEKPFICLFVRLFVCVCVAEARGVKNQVTKIGDWYQEKFWYRQLRQEQSRKNVN